MAVAALQAQHAATGSHIDKVDLRLRQRIGTPDVIVVMRIAAINDDVTGTEQRRKLCDDAIDGTGRHHQPERARRGQALDQIGECVDALGAIRRLRP